MFFRRVSAPVRGGFTLIELLVVVAVIAVLLFILLPAVMRSRAASQKTACASNLKQLATAVQQFHSRQGSLPPYWGTMSGTGAGLYGAWLLHLLPDTDQQQVYDKILESVLTSSTVPKLVLQREPVPVKPEVQQSGDYYPGDWVESPQTTTSQVQNGTAMKTVTVVEQVQVGTNTREVTEQGVVSYTTREVTEEGVVGYTTKEITEQVQTGVTTREVTEQVVVGHKNEVGANGVTVPVPIYDTVTRTVEEPVYGPVTKTVQEPVYGPVTKSVREPVYGPVTKTIQEPVYQAQSVTKSIPVPTYATVTSTVWTSKLTNSRGTAYEPPVYDYRLVEMSGSDPFGMPPNFAEVQAQASLAMLRCPGDPSEAGPVELKNPANASVTNKWSLTNYQANAHAFTKFGTFAPSATVVRGPGGRVISTIDFTFVSGTLPATCEMVGGRFPRAKVGQGATFRDFNPSSALTGTAASDKPNGLWPRRFSHMVDGQANTILFGEGMRQCEGRSRVAFLPVGNLGEEHAFGIEPTLLWPSDAALESNLKGVLGGFGNTLMFQTRPGVEGCAYFRLQANHEDVLNVAMADGSVRGISSTVSRREQADPDVAGRSKMPGKEHFGLIGFGGKADTSTVPARPVYQDGVWDMLMLPTDGAEGNVLAATGEVGKEK